MKTVRAEIITIGDEILYGQTLDTNSHFISERLSKIGVRVVRKTTVGDKETEILKAFKEAEERAEIILITGGLGPTSDDLTKPCLAKYFNCDIEINEQALEDVRSYFEKRGRELTELNKMQAALPTASKLISNPVGTAPCMWFDKEGKVFVSMPGVPHEAEYLIENAIVPRIIKTFPLGNIYHKVIKTCGIGESFLAEKISDWERSLPEHFGLAYLPDAGEVKLRLTADGDDLQQLRKEAEGLVANIQQYAGDYIYGYDDDTLESTVGKLLKAKGLTLATAESCTGGYLSHRITSVPGSSEYFRGSIIAYANNIKINHLDIPESVLKQHGAVSEETVLLMAENVRKKLNAGIGISTSGIAGPGGGTQEKPVGTVWIGYSDGKKSEARKLQLLKDREINIRYSSKALLTFLFRKLKQFD